MVAKPCSAAVDRFEAFTVEVEINGLLIGVISVFEIWPPERHSDIVSLVVTFLRAKGFQPMVGTTD